MLPFLFESDALTTDYRIRWDLRDVEACSADNNVEFVEFALSCAYTVAFYASDV